MDEVKRTAMISKCIFKLARMRDHLYRALFYKGKKISIGKYTYGAPQIYSYRDDTRLTIGRYCSISAKVTIFMGGEHRMDWISTFPFTSFFDEYRHIEGHPASKGDIRIKNDVWIGYGATILSGVTIGNGAVIGACSLVTRDVPDYAVVVGNPARIIKYRFDQKTREKLLQIQWWDWPEKQIKKFIPHMTTNQIESYFQQHER